MKKTVESRQNNSVRGKTERDVSLTCAVCLLLYSNRPFYFSLNSFIFNCALRTNTWDYLKFLDHLISLPSYFLQTFILISWYFDFVVISRCLAANFNNLETYNKHNTTGKVLRTVFTRSFLYQKSHSFDFWYVNNSCANTVRPNFPWSILYVHID